MGEIPAEEAVQALQKAGTVGLHNIWLPAFCRSALSHLLPWDFSQWQPKHV